MLLLFLLFISVMVLFIASVFLSEIYKDLIEITIYFIPLFVLLFVLGKILL